MRYHSGPKYNDNFDIILNRNGYYVLIQSDTGFVRTENLSIPLVFIPHTGNSCGCLAASNVIWLCFCFVLFFFFCLTKYDLFVSLGSESLFLLVPCVSVCFFSSVFVTPVASPLLGGGTRPRGVSTLRQAWGILCSPLWPSLAVGNFFGGFVSLASIFSFLLLRIFVFSLFLFLAFVFRLFSVAV